MFRIEKAVAEAKFDMPLSVERAEPLKNKEGPIGAHEGRGEDCLGRIPISLVSIGRNASLNDPNAFFGEGGSSMRMRTHGDQLLV